jgi:uncharacterized lipoprotein YmbA
MKNKCLGLSGVVLLGACTVFPDSPPAKLYALDLPSFAPAVSCPTNFALREMKIPGYLDRSEVVLAQEGNKIRNSAQHLWASPLVKDLSSLTGRALQQLLASSIALPYPIRQLEKPEWILSIEISRLVLNKGAYQMEITTTGYRLPNTDTKNQPSAAASFAPIFTTSTLPLGTENTVITEAEQSAKALSELLALNLPKIATTLGQVICKQKASS